MAENQTPQNEFVLPVIGVGHSGVSFVAQLAESRTSHVEYLVVQVDLPTLHHLAVVHPDDVLTGALNSHIATADILMVVADDDVESSQIVSTIARAARQREVLVLLVAPAPHHETGTQMRTEVDAYVTLALGSDSVLVVQNLVHSLVTMLTDDGIVNIAIQDIRTLLKNAGELFVLMHAVNGVHRIRRITETLEQCTMREPRLRTAVRGVVHLACGYDIDISDVTDVATAVESIVDDQALVIWGVTHMRDLPLDQLHITALLAERPA